MRRFSLVLISFVMIIVFLGFNLAEGTRQYWKVGDYVRFASYNKQPIMWRVIQLDRSGNPLLFSDRIIALKAFDAKGEAHSLSFRKDKGSNAYEWSTLRQWLNSRNTNREADKIVWWKNPPTADHLWNGMNSYAAETGFLSENHFTAYEFSLIRPYSHKVLLAGVDAARRDGGTSIHRYEFEISSVVQNDADAFYRIVKDRVFLLSVKQLKQWVYDQRSILGANYYMGKPTPAAVLGSEYKSNTLRPGGVWFYWLNTPYATKTAYVRYVGSGGGVYSDYAYRSDNGVRPALWLQMSSVVMERGGDGKLATPYVVRRNK